jgi:hypothetical protein
MHNVFSKSGNNHCVTTSITNKENTKNVVRASLYGEVSVETLCLKPLDNDADQSVLGGFPAGIPVPEAPSD